MHCLFLPPNGKWFPAFNILIASIPVAQIGSNSENLDDGAVVFTLEASPKEGHVMLSVSPPGIDENTLEEIPPKFKTLKVGYKFTQVPTVICMMVLLQL